MLFKGDYFFLSNFYECSVVLNINGNDLCFKNAEAAFQAQKNILLADKFCLLCGKEAKQYGKKIPLLTENWNEVRLYAMAKALHAKYGNKYLLFMLKLIKEDIVEDNYWNDTFWGVCKGKGNNILGKMLMNIRDNDNDYNALLDCIKKDLINYV